VFDGGFLSNRSHHGGFRRDGSFSRNIIYSAFFFARDFNGCCRALRLSRRRLRRRRGSFLIYVGGILVLILFAVMLTHRITDVQIQQSRLGQNSRSNRGRRLHLSLIEAITATRG